MIIENKFTSLEEGFNNLKKKVEIHEIKSGKKQKVRPPMLGRFIEVSELYPHYKQILEEFNEAIVGKNCELSIEDLQLWREKIQEFELCFETKLLAICSNGNQNSSLGLMTVIEAFEKYSVASEEMGTVCI